MAQDGDARGSPAPQADDASVGPYDSTQALPSPREIDATLVAASVELLTKPTCPVQDLNADKLLRDAPRVRVEGRVTPALGGIPLLAKLGQGGMGAVYYGIQPRLGQEVAVKVLPFHLVEQNPEMKQRFYREARLAVPIQSPHLVRVFDINEDHGVVFMVMEYVNGQSAGAHVKELRRAGRVLEEAVALDLSIAAAQGLAIAHARGIVHRDIKPDNILVPKGTADELVFAEAKLSDLGLARSLETAGETVTTSNVALGTPGFMAPEQGMSARTVGPAADVFSLGATLYAFLCLHPPFRGQTIMATLMETAQTPHLPVSSRRPDVSAATVAVVDRCLAKDPAQRYADAGELLTALRAARAALPEPAAASRAMALPPVPGMKDSSPLPPSPVAAGAATPAQPSATQAVESPPPAAARSRAGLAVVGVLALAALAAGVWFLLAQHGPTPAAPPEGDRTGGPTQPASVEPAAAKAEDKAKRAADALSAALTMAVNHKMSKRWQKVVDALAKPLADLADAPHPNKEDALELVAEARRELEQQRQYGEKLKTAEDLLARKEWEKAHQEFQEAGRLWPDAPERPRVKDGLAKAAAGLQSRTYGEHLQKAREAATLKDWAGAVLSYGAALQAKAGDAEAQRGLAEAQYQDGLAKGQMALTQKEWNAAQQAFERILQDRADDVAAGKGLADVRAGRGLAAAERLIADGSCAAALMELGELLKERPDDPAAKALLSRANLGLACASARLAAKNTNWATAAAEWQKALKEDGKLDEARKGLALTQAMAAGEAAVEKRDWNAGVEQFKTAHREDANLEAASKGLAYAQAMIEAQAATQQERWADAEAALQRADGVRVGAQAIRDARADVARLRTAKEQTVKAEPPKDTATEQRYTQAMTEAQGALAQQDWAKATDAYNRALREKPGDATATQGLNQARADQQRHDEQFRAALDAAEKALGRDEFDAAMRYFQDAARIRPAAKEPGDGLRRVEEARRRKVVRPPAAEPRRGPLDPGVY